jgi:hypothetical protein
MDKMTLKGNLLNSIDRPIFIIGCGRSGSTLLHKMLCAHPDLAWFSNFTTRFDRLHILASLSNLYPLRLRYNLPPILAKGIPKPSEGYRLWDIAKPVQNSPSDPPLSKGDAGTEEKNRISEIINYHLKYQGRTRFINKNTRNTRRIRFLDSIFPDSLFIHILRDPRASVASLMKVYWWPELKIWNQDLVTPQAWIHQGKDPVTLAVNLWRDETRFVLDNQRNLKDRLIRIRYEDLITSVKDILEEIINFCDLSWNNRFEKLVNKFEVNDMNYKYKSELTQNQICTIKKETGAILEDMGCFYY